MAARFRSDPRPWTTVDAHRIKVVFRSACFAGGEVKLRAVPGEIDISDLELAGGELLRVAAQRGDCVEMIRAVALAFEIDFVTILKPADCFIARPIEPRIVVLVEQRSGLRGGGIQQLNPAVLIVD